MSRIRQTRIATPSNPPVNTAEIYYANAGAGFNSPAECQAIDESGNVAVLATFAVPSYRFIKRTILTAASGTHTPQNGTRLMVVQCWGGGGGGGGAATSSTQVSVGGGGGGGSWAMKALTGAAIKATAFVVGAGGTASGAGATGNNGSDTTWDTNVVVGKGGTGGSVLAAGTTVVSQVSGAGGVAGTGDATMVGGVGDSGMRFSTTLGFAGNGGMGPFLGINGASGAVSSVGGALGVNAPNNSAAGGGGSGTASTAAAGTVGGSGLIVVDEYA